MLDALQREPLTSSELVILESHPIIETNRKKKAGPFGSILPCLILPVQSSYLFRQVFKQPSPVHDMFGLVSALFLLQLHRLIMALRIDITFGPARLAVTRLCHGQFHRAILAFANEYITFLDFHGLTSFL
jgi:hypothetical protein